MLEIKSSHPSLMERIIKLIGESPTSEKLFPINIITYGESFNINETFLPMEFNWRDFIWNYIFALIHFI